MSTATLPTEQTSSTHTSTYGFTVGQDTTGTAHAFSQARLNAMLAQVRDRQLRYAQEGNIEGSAGLAQRAKSLRAVIAGVTSRSAAAIVVLIMLPTLAWAQPASPVRTGEVRQQMVQDHRMVTGSLQAVSRSNISAQESGLVNQILVNEGSLISKGDVILTLDSRRLNAQVRQAEAELANAQALVTQYEAELKLARFNHEREQGVYQRGASTDQELNERETQVQVGEAQLSAAQRTVERIERELEHLAIRVDDLTVRAPFDAQVVARHIEPGEWIDPGQAVVTLVSTGLIEARIEVPERYAPTVMQKPGIIFIALSNDGRTIESVNVRPIAQVDPRARTFQVIVTLQNGANELVPGMSINAWVPTSDESLALVAPKDAVIRNGRDAYVYKVNAGDTNSAERSPVRVLFTLGDQVALASDDLSDGDTVVVEGNERLFNGATVTLAKLPTAAETN
ncbi:MAG: efflux RND transporter periplasmic adaptor subunit [Planctomycetota bacterium]